MRKGTVKFTALALSALLIILSFATVSCADTASDPADTTAAPSSLDSLPVTEEITEEDTTPVFPEANYGGDSFVVISRSPSASSYPAFYIGTEEPTDVMSSAVYTRNTVTEEKYGIKIEQLVSDAIDTAIRNGVSSGTMDFDVVLNQREKLAALATSGYLYDFNNLGSFLCLNKKSVIPIGKF